MFCHASDGKPLLCRLRRALYGLKQSGRLWYRTIRRWLLKYGFRVLVADQCVFVLERGCGAWVLCWIYVDDMGAFGNCARLCDEFLAALAADFRLSVKGALQYYLGVTVTVVGRTVQIDQRKYLREQLERFGLDDTYAVSTPVAGKPSDDKRLLPADEAAHFRTMVGCLVWLATMTV